MLAALGAYGSFRYLVASRRRELALRMVLGAGHGRLLLGVLAEVMTLGLLGVMAGLS